MKELLKALAESDRELEAGPAVERRLRSAFRKRYAHPKWPYFAIAAAVALAVLLYPRPKVQTLEIKVFTPSVAIVPAARPVVARRKAPPKEIVTDFFPLMEDPPPFERGELLRVSLPASAMRSVGLTVSEDRLDDAVQADVLVGQEGLARAIRFVNASVNRP
jgi:hypothetical protein